MFFSAGHSRGHGEDTSYVRVVQSPGVGQGLQATREIPAGTAVARYSGHKMATIAQLEQRIRTHGPSKILEVRSGADSLWIDASESPDLRGLVNHGCGKTAGCPAQTVLIRDDVDRDEVWIVTTRAVAQGEELLLDYCVLTDSDERYRARQGSVTHDDADEDDILLLEVPAMISGSDSEASDALWPTLVGAGGHACVVGLLPTTNNTTTSPARTN